MKHQSIHLANAVEILEKKMKTPEAFIDFITEALSWVHNYEVKTAPNEINGHHFSFILIMQKLAMPWLMEKKVPEEGMHKLVDFFGAEGYDECVATLFAAYAMELKNCGHPSIEVSKEEMNGINTLIEIGHCLYEYDMERKQMKVAA